MTEEQGSAAWNSDVGREDSFSKDPRACMGGELQEAVKLNPGTKSEKSQAEQATGRFDMAETLVHVSSLWCRKKMSEVFENLRVRLSQAWSKGVR